eukprot:GFYU01023745.1.p1 GENE.GFYU01023745.1~~GFYU01023745.1.p1  ORF type:complete len:195 (+),score=45.93 GFYU01023745.1:134-718(+)
MTEVRRYGCGCDCGSCVCSDQPVAEGDTGVLVPLLDLEERQKACKCKATGSHCAKKNVADLNFAEGVKTVQLSIPTMTCDGCVKKLQTAFLSVDGVYTSNVDLASKTATITGHMDSAFLLKAVLTAGKEATILQSVLSPRSLPQTSSPRATYSLSVDSDSGIPTNHSVCNAALKVRTSKCKSLTMMPNRGTSMN